MYFYTQKNTIVPFVYLEIFFDVVAVVVLNNSSAGTVFLIFPCEISGCVLCCCGKVKLLAFLQWHLTGENNLTILNISDDSHVLY